MVNVSVGSAVGACTVGHPAFYRYVLRLADIGIPVDARQRDLLAILAAVPHAYADDDERVFGAGWRIVPPASLDDWPVLEATPSRLRDALETARALLWSNAAPVGITAVEIVDLDAEIDRVLGVVSRAEVAGVSVNLSYIS